MLGGTEKFGIQRGEVGVFLGSPWFLHGLYSFVDGVL